jgi:microcompartment protein CcmK/EutM
MQFAKVIGTVVSTRKVDSLMGVTLKLIESGSEKLVAIDPIGTRVGDQVMWVGKREASLAIPGTPINNSYPIDAAITGIIDDIS